MFVVTFSSQSFSGVDLTRTESQKLLLVKAMLLNPEVRDRLKAVARPVPVFNSPIDMSEGFKVMDIDEHGKITSFWNLNLEGDVEAIEQAIALPRF